LKKPTPNVFPFVERRNPDLHGHIYLPLDRRQQGNEPVFSRIYRGEYWITDDYVGWFQIPKGMILSRKTLKRATKGKSA